jgi:hypothetical protein
MFLVGAAACAGFAHSLELVPVFAEGPCPRFSRRRDIRARASEALATLVPAMAAAVQFRAEPIAHGSEGIGRDACLAARARTRRLVQRGLFERSAEREAEEIEAEAAGPSDDAISQPPQPVLLLFVTR